VPSPEYIEIMGPALAVGLMVALMHAPMGIEVLRRGIVFIDLAIAQIAGLYVVLVKLWWHEPSWLLIQMAAAMSAVAAAVFFRWVEKAFPREQEAIIGSIFILAASGALLALADHPRGGEEMQHILAGQILFVQWTEVAIFLPVYVVAFALWFWRPVFRQGFAFFLLFAIVVTASVQLVGVYVVFASLILPALATSQANRRNTAIALVTGVASVIVGILLSTYRDLPAGPVMVFCFAAMAIAARLIITRQQVDRA
jgi:zinc/manganese transport system permease protein